jgi:hypothetical protein
MIGWPCWKQKRGRRKDSIFNRQSGLASIQVSDFATPLFNSGGRPAQKQKRKTA